MTDLDRLQRLCDAAEVLRAVHKPAEGRPLHAALFAAVAEWLEDTARRAGYSTRGVDVTNAHRVADLVLGGPLDDRSPTDPGERRYVPTQKGLAYLAARSEQQPKHATDA